LVDWVLQNLLYEEKCQVIVGIKEIKNQLSRYLRQVKQGETVVITERNIPIAKIIPLKSQELKDILTLQEAGLATWHGGKPAGLKLAPKIKGNRLISEIVAEDRR